MGNPFSMTEAACTCHCVQDFAKSADSPITYDPETNEYQIRYPVAAGEGSITLYHCFICGGLLPKSIRGDLFFRIEGAEEQRLLKLFDQLTSFEDLACRFGKPDQDHPRGFATGQHEGAGVPPVKQYFRRVVYERLSATVDVHITEDERGRLHVGLQGKYKGRNAP